MWFFMELWACLKTNLIVFGTAFDKATVIHFLDATIKNAPVGVLCIFGSQYIMGSVLKSFSNSKSNLLERVILWSVTSFFSLSTSLSVLLCVPCNPILSNHLQTECLTNKRKVAWCFISGGNTKFCLKICQTSSSCSKRKVLAFFFLTFSNTLFYLQLFLWLCKPISSQRYPLLCGLRFVF